MTKYRACPLVVGRFHFDVLVFCRVHFFFLKLFLFLSMDRQAGGSGTVVRGLSPIKRNPRGKVCVILLIIYIILSKLVCAFLLFVLYAIEAQLNIL